MYLFFKKHWYKIAILLVLFLSIISRGYKLGVIPHGMTWDEAAIGYNGYAIWHTRRDEWLQKLPTSFQSFGDYKAPLAIYLNGLFTFIFGMNLLAVRVPFFIASILTIYGFSLLLKEVFNNKFYSMIGAFLIFTSPWHFHYSRTGFESGLSLMFLVWGLYFLFKSLRFSFSKQFLTLLSGVSFVLSIYSYHSAKIVVPLLLLIFLMIFFKQIKNVGVKKLILPTLLSGFLLYPLLKDSIYGNGLARAGVTVFSQNLSSLEKILYVVKSYFAHLSPKFLLLAQTTTIRHSAGYLGVLLPTTFILFIFGVVLLFKFKKSYLTTLKRKYLLFFFNVVVVGLLPACIAMEVPHSNRAFLSIVGFLVVAIYGLEYLIRLIKETKINKKTRGSHDEQDIIFKSVVGILLVVHLFLFISFINYYFITFAKESADAFKDGYLEAFSIARNYEKGVGVEEVDKIVFTSDYGQPYIYALFVRKTNPIWYRGGSLIKYEFTDKISIGDLTRDNALVIASKDDDLPVDKATHVVYGSDGEVRFKIYKTKKE